MTVFIPDYLKEQAAADVDRTGEVSDATKEAIAALADNQTLPDLFAAFDAFVAERPYLAD